MLFQSIFSPYLIFISSDLKLTKILSTPMIQQLLDPTVAVILLNDLKQHKGT